MANMRGGWFRVMIVTPLKTSGVSLPGEPGSWVEWARVWTDGVISKNNLTRAVSIRAVQLLSEPRASASAPLPARLLAIVGPESFIEVSLTQDGDVKTRDGVAGGLPMILIRFGALPTGTPLPTEWWKNCWLRLHLALRSPLLPVGAAKRPRDLVPVHLVLSVKAKDFVVHTHPPHAARFRVESAELIGEGFQQTITKGGAEVGTLLGPELLRRPGGWRLAPTSSQGGLPATRGVPAILCEGMTASDRPMVLENPTSLAWDCHRVWLRACVPGGWKNVALEVLHSADGWVTPPRNVPEFPQGRLVQELARVLPQATLAPFGLRPSSVLGVDEQLDSLATLVATPRGSLDLVWDAAPGMSTEAPRERWTLRARFAAPDTDRLPDASSWLAWWNRKVAEPVFEALRIADSEAAVSVLPRFVCDERGDPTCELEYTVDDPDPARQDDPYSWEFSPRDQTVQFLNRKVQLSAFRDHRGQALERKYNVDVTAGSQGVTFTLKESGGSTSTVRIGALDLTIAESSSDTSDKNRLSVEVNKNSRAPSGWSVSLALPLKAVTPGSQDPLPPDLTETGQSDLAPQIVVMEGAITYGGFVLRAEESSHRVGDTEARERLLALHIERTQGQGVRDVAFELGVLDRGPFNVARVRFNLDLSRSEVARWSKGDDGFYRWSVPTSTALTLIEPPLAVGEDMFDDEKDPQLGERVKLRLGTTTVATLRLSERPSRQHVAPWNLRWHIADPTGEVPGLRLESLSAELLYGLAFTVTRDDLCFAEVGARLGRLPSLIDTRALLAGVSVQGDGPDARTTHEALTRSVEAYARTQREVYQAITSRVARFELLSVLSPMDPPRIDRGVRARFRPGREIRHPVLNEAPGYPSDGLRGGVDWGIKSENMLAEIRDKYSSSAWLDGFAVTPIGGHGRQRVEFDGGKSVIDAVVVQGRLMRYSFERLGRIGVLWNRARYVVVYERVIHAGRAVLQKVDEYVLLLDQERAYPDRKPDESAPGFVTAAHFGREKIPVNAAYGRDVPGGWIVPLFTPEDPKAQDPELFLQCELPPNQTSATARRRVRNPSELVFFTSTQETGDPDSWKPCEWVDFPVCGVPSPGGTPPSGENERGISAPRTATGYGRFTFELEPGPGVNLVANRGGLDPVGVVVENVTLARRNLQAAVETPLGRALQGLGKARSTADRFVAALGSGTNLNDIIENIKTAVRDALGEFEREARERILIRHERLRGYLVDAIKENKANLQKIVEVGIARLLDAKTRGDEVAAIVQAWGGPYLRGGSVVHELQLRVRLAVTVVRRQLERWKQTLGEHVRRLEDARRAGVIDYREAVVWLLASVQETYGVAVAQAVSIQNDLSGAALDLLKMLAARLKVDRPVEEIAGVEVGRVLGEVAEALETCVVALNAKLEAVTKAVNEIEEHVEGRVKTICGELAKGVFSTVDSWVEAFRSNVETAVRMIEGAIRSRLDLPALVEAEGALQNVLKDYEGLAHAAATWASDLGTALSDTLAESLRKTVAEVLAVPLAGLVGPVEAHARVVSVVVGTSASEGMRLLRAYGEAPVAEFLKFNRDRVEYCFEQARVALTPILATVFDKAKTIAETDLQSLALRLPVTGLTDQLLLSTGGKRLQDLLPRFAGLDLRELLKGAATPLGEFEQKVHVRHGFDRATARAWVRTDLDAFQLPQAVDLVNVSPLCVTLEAATLEAHAEASASPSGVAYQTAAQLQARWRVAVANVPVLTFGQATLTVDSEHGLRFNLDTRTIKLADALQFLSDLLSAVSPPGGGFSLEVSPKKVTARLNLSLPALQAGAFSVSGLALAIEFGVSFEPFALSVKTWLATRERPFNLSILCLGGGGWFGTRLSHVPSTNETEGGLSFGLAVGASLPFDIGVARGCVQILIDAAVEWAFAAGGGGVSFSIGATLRGELEILKVISVSVLVALRVTYHSGGTLVLAGILHVRVKILFFSLSVSKGFEKVLTGGGRATPFEGLFEAGEPPWVEVANAYVDGFAFAE